MKKQFGDYYLGLDIGTGTVGWSVTDTQYKLIKFNNKDMWGSRLFDDANTAEDRRINRNTRRRTARVSQRVAYLKEIFANEISKKDMGFYLRLQESKYYAEDKTIKQTNGLFCDENFKDKDYFEKYPTIYHLRKELMENKSEHDIRLVYLALHHIIKHRGHFLFEGQQIDSITSFENVFKMLENYIRDEYGEELSLIIDNDYSEIENILKNKNMNLTNKKKALASVFKLNNLDKKCEEEKTLYKKKEAIISLFIGGKTNLQILFPNELAENDEFKSFSFDANYEDMILKISSTISIEAMYLIEKIKAVYDWSILEEILGTNNTLSSAKVNVYEQHKEDLKLLKDMVKEYIPDKYKQIFNIDKAGKINNYEAYINNQCTQEELCKYLDVVFKGIQVNNKYIVLQDKITNRTLCPMQVSKDNGVIPYQLHEQELTKILANAREYLPFLLEKDSSGKTNEEKIKDIFKFKIPYYVGPLGKVGNNIWCVRKEEGKIYPWNFENKIDVEKSAEQFILRMTNMCTYLQGENVLPKDSLIYSQYMVLNELNNLKINNEEISIELKEKIFYELFMKYKKVTQKGLMKFLKDNGEDTKNITISGIDGDFKASLKTYIVFEKILARGNNENMVENIISWSCLFGDDRNMLKNKIIREYGNNLSSDDIKNIMSNKFTGWGRLSNKLLNGIKSIDKETGEVLTILKVMHETNLNLMQIINDDKYEFKELIKQSKMENVLYENTFDYNHVEDLYVSPSVKRQIWQSMRIVEEISKIMGHEPLKVFVETTRSEGEKGKRTQSRKDRLVELYQGCKEESKKLLEVLENTEEAKLRSDKLYLYYTQLGKCMYSGKTIEIGELYDENKYDIDHIYPQSRVKDDSIENRVLVLKNLNAKKNNDYPIDSNIRNNMKEYWKMLLDKGLIGEKKYSRLTRNTGFGEDELSDFIARQLVETSQATKAVAEILQEIFPKSDIVYVKANNVSEFRQKNDIVKVRELNDFHHAYDAYLNIVVGNVYNVKFTKNPINFIRSKDGKNYSMNRVFDYDVVRGDNVAWIAKNEEQGIVGTIDLVRKIVKKNTPIVTCMPKEGKGQLFDIMPVKAQSKDSTNELIPLKNDIRLQDTSKYGGYNSIKGAYFMIVEHTDKKGKRIKTLEYLPIYLKSKLETITAKEQYCKDKGLLEPRIVVAKVMMNSLFMIDGVPLYITGRTGDRVICKHGIELCIDETSQKYIKKIVKFNKINKTKGGMIKIYESDKITTEENIKLYDLLRDKLENTIYNKILDSQVKNLDNGRKKFETLAVEEQCEVLGEILKFFQCNSVISNLSKIGAGSTVGKILISKDLSKRVSVKMIHYSPTGMFAKEVDVLKL